MLDQFVSAYFEAKRNLEIRGEGLAESLREEMLSACRRGRLSIRTGTENIDHDVVMIALARLRSDGFNVNRDRGSHYVTITVPRKALRG